MYIIYGDLGYSDVIGIKKTGKRVYGMVYCEKKTECSSITDRRL